MRIYFPPLFLPHILDNKVPGGFSKGPRFPEVLIYLFVLV